MASVPVARPPAPAPLPNSSPQQEIIKFHHPGYQPRWSLLFFLPRVDPTGIGSLKGVHHETALTACQIVAGSIGNGQLCVDRRGEQPVTVAQEPMLIRDEYYFVLNSDATFKYPVVPSFREWEFPHGRIPMSWPSPNQGVPSPDGDRCAVTNHYSGLKKAHIVPKEEHDWYQTTGMSQYSHLHHYGNRMHLRADIHKCYDTREFVVVPKRLRDSQGGGPGRRTFVVHYVGQEANPEFESLYHNLPMQHINLTARETHFARFAWTILQFAKEFITMGQRRVVLRPGPDGVVRAEELSGWELRKRYDGGGDHIASPLHPRKRAKAEMQEEEEDEEE